MHISAPKAFHEWVSSVAMTIYVMAWFMWQLQNDEEAGKAFIGENAEIMHNEMYQDQKSDFHE